MKLFLCVLSLFVVPVFGFKVFAQPNAVTGKPDKQFLQMSEPEKATFIKTKSAEILALFGKAEGDEINEAGYKRIRRFIDSYAKRINVPKNSSCQTFPRNDLASILRRGKLHADEIQAAFKSVGLPVQIGIYTAMIESEFCPCLQSPTGPLGIFQFTFQVANIYGIKAVKGATPKKPDERCKVESAAKAAANYFKKLTEKDFGNDENGVLLAIAAFNAGEGLTKTRLNFVRDRIRENKIGFWRMSDFIESNELQSDENGLSENIRNQFLRENINYVPKFIAAAIVGENPRIFGIEMVSLSDTGNN